VALPAEVLDFLNVVLEDRRLSTLVMPIELGEVVDLNVVHNRLGQSVGSASFPLGTLK